MPKTPLTDKEYQGTHDIVCPYCGHEVGDSWELTDDEDEWICYECDKTFRYERVVYVSYNSYPAKEDEED